MGGGGGGTELGGGGGDTRTARCPSDETILDIFAAQVFRVVANVILREVIACAHMCLQNR